MSSKIATRMTATVTTQSPTNGAVCAAVGVCPVCAAPRSGAIDDGISADAVAIATAARTVRMVRTSYRVLSRITLTECAGSSWPNIGPALVIVSGRGTTLRGSATVLTAVSSPVIISPVA